MHCHVKLLSIYDEAKLLFWGQKNFQNKVALKTNAAFMNKRNIFYKII